MELDTLITGIQTRLKTEMASTVGDRVFVMASKVAVPKSYQFPYIAIIYNGGIRKGKKLYGLREHDIDVIIFQTIWNEEFVVTGTTLDTGNNRGLLKLLGDVEDALEDYEIPTVTTGKNVWSEIRSYIGTEDWVTDGKYSASIGVKLNYGVEYGI